MPLQIRKRISYNYVLRTWFSSSGSFSGAIVRPVYGIIPHNFLFLSSAWHYSSTINSLQFAVYTCKKHMWKWRYSDLKRQLLIIFKKMKKYWLAEVFTKVWHKLCYVLNVSSSVCVTSITWPFQILLVGTPKEQNKKKTFKSGIYLKWKITLEFCL